MADVLTLKELLKLFGCEGKAIVSINCAGGSILGDQFLKLFEEGKG